MLDSVYLSCTGFEVDSYSDKGMVLRLEGVGEEGLLNAMQELPDMKAIVDTFTTDEILQEIPVDIILDHVDSRKEMEKLTSELTLEQYSGVISLALDSIGLDNMLDCLESSGEDVLKAAIERRALNQGTLWSRFLRYISWT